MIKRRSIRLLGATALLVSLLPLANLVIWRTPQSLPCCAREALFNIDGLIGWVSSGLFRVGVSIAPEKTIIGKNEWLYLGDAYDKSLSFTRFGGGPIHFSKGQNFAKGASRWDAYFKSEGVRLFQIMIAPNKESIYPEFLPNWASPKFPSVTDFIVNGARSPIFIDLRKTLLEAKASRPEPLFFKLDTHWNMFGASFAFHEFANRVKLQLPEVRWPDATRFRLSKVYDVNGGDLAGFLRLDTLADKLPILDINRQASTFLYHDYGTNRVIDRTKSGEARAILTRPVVTENAHALNQARVLWLSDSFGAHLADPMSATFSQVARVHWSQAFEDGGTLVRMVREWKPDFVFVTVAERSFREGPFASFLDYAPLPAAHAAQGHLAKTPLTVKSLSGLINSGEEGVFEITSSSPSMVLSAPADVDVVGNGAFFLELTCLDKSESLPVQIFWKSSANPRFHRDHALRFLHVGPHSILSLSEVGVAPIHDIRLDLKPNGFCRRFRWGGLEHVG